MGYHKVLETWHQDPVGRKGRYGVRKLSGSLLITLDAIDEPWSRLMANEIIEFIVSKPELATRAPEIAERRKQVPLEQRMMTMLDAKQFLGVSYDTLSGFAEAYDLYRVPPTGSGAPALLWAQRVHALAERRLGLLTKTEVLRYLGSGKATVDKLRDAGLLPYTEDHEQIVYSIDGVTALLDDLRSRIQPSSERESEMVGIATIARRMPVPDFDVADIVLAVQAGELIPRAIAAYQKGLQQFLFSDIEVTEFILRYVDRKRATLSVSDAAVMLGVTQEAAYDWVRSEFLETTISDVPGEAGRRVTQAALAAFQREYMTSTEYGKLHRLSWRHLISALEKLGLQPVSGPSVDGGRQFLFRRAELERVDPATLVGMGLRQRPLLVRSNKGD